MPRFLIDASNLVLVMCHWIFCICFPSFFFFQNPSKYLNNVTNDLETVNVMQTPLTPLMIAYFRFITLAIVFVFQVIQKKCINNHTITSACLNIADARCPTECRVTEALSESDVRLWKQPKSRRWSLSAAHVPCPATLSANYSVSQGQSGAFRLLNVVGSLVLNTFLVGGINQGSLN